MTRKQEQKGRGLFTGFCGFVSPHAIHYSLFTTHYSLFAGFHAGGREGWGPGQVPPFLLSTHSREPPDLYPSCWPARRALCTQRPLPGTGSPELPVPAPFTQARSPLPTC